MTAKITHVAMEIEAETAQDAYLMAKKFNQEHLDGAMKAIIADEIATHTYWVTLAQYERMARLNHETYLSDNGWR